MWHTTGPYSLRRLVKLNSSEGTMHTARYLECNYFMNAPSVSQARAFDVISHESGSYFTNEHAIHVPVGDGATILPTRPKSLRMRRKCKLRRTVGDGVVTSQGVHSGGGAAVVVMEAPRDRDGDATPNGQADDASARGQGGDAAAREQDNSDADVEKWNVEMEFIEDNDRINEFRSYLL